MKPLPANYDFTIGETVFVRDRLNPCGLIDGLTDLCPKAYVVREEDIDGDILGCRIEKA